MRQYRYRPLEPGIGHIRLLRIEKPQENDQPPVLHLRHARLEDEAFNALSYAWGAESPTHEIVIRDGNQQRTLSVRQNLYEFLKIAPTIAEDWSSQWIWIDQICINQENTKERNHQVAQMGALYSTAQTTILWPGRLDVSGDYDLECHEQELSSPLIPPEHMETIVAKHDPQRLISTDNRGDPQGLRRLLGTLTGATLMRLMLQRYWRRLWVTQEIVLAAHVRIIIADSTHALEDWDSALKVFWLSELPAIQYLRGNDFLHLELLKIRVTMGHYMLMRSGIRKDQKIAQVEKYVRYATWETILGLNWQTECTTQHDRVYALMGLLPKSLHVDPDYDIPLSQLLKAILEKQMTYLARSLSSGHPIVGGVDYNPGLILAYWFGFINLDPIELQRYYRVSYPDIVRCYDEGWKADSTVRTNIERNVRLVLEDLGIPIPSDLTLDQIDPT